MQPFSHLQRGFRVVGAFHVDADEVAGLRGVGYEFAYDAFSQIRPGAVAADIHAHGGELHADVGAQFAGGDLIQQLVVERGALFGLRDLDDAFAKRIERSFDVFRVELRNDVDGFIDAHAGDETAGKPLPERVALREGAEWTIGG